ncbi:MAG: hypothetical protein KIT69_21290, partial [Propionibacteriaceae bacterium]|nr:hypothetical protein [Propionibacteriaceae bacterium]
MALVKVPTLFRIMSALIGASITTSVEKEKEISFGPLTITLGLSVTTPPLLSVELSTEDNRVTTECAGLRESCSETCLCKTGYRCSPTSSICLPTYDHTRRCHALRGGFDAEYSVGLRESDGSLMGLTSGTQGSILSTSSTEPIFERICAVESQCDDPLGIFYLRLYGTDYCLEFRDSKWGVATCLPERFQKFRIARNGRLVCDYGTFVLPQMKWDGEGRLVSVEFSGLNSDSFWDLIAVPCTSKSYVTTLPSTSVRFPTERDQLGLEIVLSINPVNLFVDTNNWISPRHYLTHREKFLLDFLSSNRNENVTGGVCPDYSCFRFYERTETLPNNE